jgi:hypothetical protein
VGDKVVVFGKLVLRVERIGSAKKEKTGIECERVSGSDSASEVVNVSHRSEKSLYSQKKNCCT